MQSLPSQLTRLRAEVVDRQRSDEVEVVGVVDVDLTRAVERHEQFVVE